MTQDSQEPPPQTVARGRRMAVSGSVMTEEQATSYVKKVQLSVKTNLYYNTLRLSCLKYEIWFFCLALSMLGNLKTTYVGTLYVQFAILIFI